MIRGSTFQRLVRGPQTWVFDLEATGKRVHNRDVFNVAFAERLQVHFGNDQVADFDLLSVQSAAIAPEPFSPYLDQSVSFLGRILCQSGRLDT